jgi:DNA-binding NarL/FixJ family response regulator
MPINGTEVAGMRVILADDHVMVLEILADALVRKEAMTVRTATSFDDALRLASMADPVDLIVLDYDMQGMNGYDGLRRMVALQKAPVAILTDRITHDMTELVQASGGAGLLSKSFGISEVIGLMRRLGLGGTAFPVQNAGAVAIDIPILSKNQNRVIRMIAAGQSNSDIAIALAMPLSTVKMHVRAIFKQLGARNRTDAVRIWHRDYAPFAKLATQAVHAET